jgi:hypothetical protein
LIGQPGQDRQGTTAGRPGPYKGKQNYEMVIGADNKNIEVGASPHRMKLK